MFIIYYAMRSFWLWQMIFANHVPHSKSRTARFSDIYLAIESCFSLSTETNEESNELLNIDIRLCWNFIQITFRCHFSFFFFQYLNFKFLVIDKLIGTPTNISASRIAWIYCCFLVHFLINSSLFSFKFVSNSNFLCAPLQDAFNSSAHIANGTHWLSGTSPTCIVPKNMTHAAFAPLYFWYTLIIFAGHGL